MTSSSDADGNLVDEPPAPYMIPIDAIAIDPKPYARFLPPETRAIVGNLLDGQAILGQTSAKLRHLGPGSVMRFEGGSSVTVLGVLPDELVGAAEVIVNRATGGTIGVTQNRYLLFQTSPGLQPSSQQLEKRFRAVLPPGLLYPVVRVRSPGETTYLRADDDTLPPALVKRRFGEWAGRPQIVDGRRGRSDVGARPHRDGHDPGARSRGLQRTSHPAAPWRHERPGGAGSGIDDPLVRRMLRRTVRSVVAVGGDLAQRVGRRRRHQRRREPERNPASAGSPAGRRDGGLGFAWGGTWSCPTGCTSTTSSPGSRPARIHLRSHTEAIVEGSRYQASRLHVLGSRGQPPRVLSMPPAA